MRPKVDLVLQAVSDEVAAVPEDPVAAALRRSPLFDAAFYCAALAARGLGLHGLEPVEHYVQRGDAARVPPHPLFDPRYYASANPDVVGAGANLLRHYVENGHREGRDPHPLVDLKLIRAQLAADFSGDPLIAYLQSRGAELKPHRLVDPEFICAQRQRVAARDERPALVIYLDSDPRTINPSVDFDGAGYWRLYPDARGVNPLIHYAVVGEIEGRRAPRDRGPVGHAAAVIEAAGRLDPDVVKPFADVVATPLTHGYDMARREFRLYRRLAKAAGRHAYAHVIVTPWLKRGGADRAVIELARALLETDPAVRVLIVCTQSDEVEALDWAPTSRRLAVARIAAEIDDEHDTCVAFCNFLRLAGCRRLYVVNSRFGWDLLEKYGATLRSLMRLYGFAFCQDYDDEGRRAGYAWTRLNRAIDRLHALVSDNSRTIHEFAADHGFDAEDLAKFFWLPLPVDDKLDGVATLSVARNLTLPGRRPRVFWAGRFTPQKGLDVAADTARALPDVDICAFGGAETPDGAPKNFLSRGAFDDFADLPLHEASMFLHTALWEGLPNVLLEAGAAGLPIVARDVGGVGDLLDETTGWPVARDADAAGFAAAIAQALARPDEAMARAERMRARIRERHDRDVFSQAVRRLLAFGGAAE